MVSKAGFEPAASRIRIENSTGLSYLLMNRDFSNLVQIEIFPLPKNYILKQVPGAFVQVQLWKTRRSLDCVLRQHQGKHRNRTTPFESSVAIRSIPVES